MKKLIVLLILSLIAISTINVFASGQDGIYVECIIEGNEITGFKNEGIDENAYIEIVSGSYTFDTESIYEDDDVTEWFGNIPEGVFAYIADISESNIIIKFTGTPTVTSNNVATIYIPSMYILDEVGPISDDPEELTLVDNDCAKFNIKEPGIDCDQIDITVTKGDDINEEIVITIVDDGQAYFIGEEIEKYINEVNGLTISYKGLNEMHNVLTLVVTGTITKDGQYPIDISAEAISLKQSISTNKPCLIVETKEPTPDPEPSKPDKPFTPAKTGVE